MNRKELLIIVILTLNTVLCVNAQKIQFGLTTGFDVANAHRINPPIPDKIYYPMISFNVNGYLGYRNNALWGLSVEPGFIQKGALEKNGINDVRLQLNYFQVPILVNMYLSKKIFISLGPEIAYLIKAKFKSEDYSNDASSLYNKKLELSGLVGVSYEIRQRIDVGLRYNHGFTNIIDLNYTDDNGVFKGAFKDYNQYLQLIVRYKI